MAECLVHRHAQLLLDYGARLLQWKRWHPVEQFFQFVGDFIAKQIAPCRHHLSKLDEDRTQFFDAQAQALVPGCARCCETS